MEIGNRLIHQVELLEIIGVSRSTIDRWVLSGNFPAAIKLSTSRKAWKGNEVKEWIESRDRLAPLKLELSGNMRVLNEVFNEKN